MHRFSEKGKKLNKLLLCDNLLLWVNNVKHLAIKQENKFGCIFRHHIRGKGHSITKK